MKWYKCRGYTGPFKFKDDEIDELKSYFNALDDDGGGSIGVDEMEIPLVSLGIAGNREQVEDIILSVDDDGEISFEEFLNILTMKPADGESELGIV